MQDSPDTVKSQVDANCQTAGPGLDPPTHARPNALSPMW
jgi:hypothetical protein